MKLAKFIIVGVWGNCSFSAAQTGNRIYNSKEESPAELFGRVGQVHANVAPPPRAGAGCKDLRVHGGAWGCMRLQRDGAGMEGMENQLEIR